MKARLGTPDTALVLTAGFVVLALNSAYLASSAAPTLWYFTNVIAHVVAGTALAAGTAAWFWRNRRRATPLIIAALVPLGIGAAFGGAVYWWGATRPYRWILDTHIAFSVVGGLVAIVALFRSGLRHPQPWLRRLALTASAAMVVAALAAAAVSATRQDRRRDAYRITNPTFVPVSMHEEGGGSRSPFFPSSAQTNTGTTIPANFFLTSEQCGRCHKDIYEQWNSSAHHFSSFNNQWYRKSIEYMQDVVGTRPSKWCAGCHDHAVFFNGRFDRPIKDQIATPEAQAGLGCMSCHAITHVGSTMGQGDFTIEYPPLHDLATSDQPALRWLHDKLLALDPQPHREAFLKPFHREQPAEFCSGCHKVHLDVPVNGYRWFRGFNDYDNWQASGVSGEGARSFYYPPTPQTCADCHMPLVPAANDPAAKNGMVRSHRFPAANVALPFVNGDRVQLDAVQQFLRAKVVSVDVFGIVREGPVAPGTSVRPAVAEPRIASTFAVGEESANFGAPRAVLLPPAEVVAPLDRVNASVRRSESVRVEVVVRTRKVGHFFPGGTVDAFDVWTELEVVDDHGRTIFHSGWVEDQGRGPVEPSAHFYRSLLLDGEGNPINKRNAWMARSMAYVRLIPPGAADTVHYRVTIPPWAGDRLQLRARVNYRKFAWWNTQWSFAGVRDPQHTDFKIGPGFDSGRWVFTGSTDRVSGNVKSIPVLPVTVMAEATATLRVSPRDTASPDARPYYGKDVRERWNDYGIGLLLQGDLKGAEAAFVRVTGMDPGYADGWVNVARARIQEGNMEGAEEVLRRAQRLDPGLAKTHFFLATTLKASGRYREAIEHLEQAAARYPRDRVVRNQLGRVLFLNRQYRKAIAELRRVLEIDPEDLQAHYNLMLAYQGLGDADAALRERKLYERFKADEASQSITGPYRRLHRHDNNERQPIHEHGPGEPSGYDRGASAHRQTAARAETPAVVAAARGGNE